MKLARTGTVAALAALAALGVGLLAGGCEAIVPSDVATPSCTMTQYVDPGNGTCPGGISLRHARIASRRRARGIAGSYWILPPMGAR